MSFGSRAGEGADHRDRQTGHEAAARVVLVAEGGDHMAPRGGPWRASGPVTLGSVADRQPGQASGEPAIAGDRMLRRVVYAYLVSVVVAGAVALVGLHEGLW